jgi:hypothetical protein
MKTINEARERSVEDIETLRKIARETLSDQTELIVGINGSLARREITSGSDVDLFFLNRNGSFVNSGNVKIFQDAVVELKFKLPSEGGVFEDVLSADELVNNIGGQNDNNVSLTRRLLFLLEAEWLHNPVGFKEVRRELLQKYISDKTPKDKIALFLLNDIIRYWRTMCVDYEYKTAEGKKPRGIRLVKLRFSRMFMVFAGIVAVAETIDLEPNQKIEKLVELFSFDALTRVQRIMGDNFITSKSLYDEFLAALDHEHTRGKLSSASYSSTKEFNDLRLKGRKFRDQLLGLLSEKYPDTHPIHKALLL